MLWIFSLAEEGGLQIPNYGFRIINAKERVEE